MKTILASVLAAAFLISVPTARAEEPAPAGEKQEKGKKGKAEKKEKKEEGKEAGGSW